MIKPQGYFTNSSELIDKHSSLVQKIACHLMARLPASVLLDDLVQSGMIGLLEAARNFDMKKGASFETFAGIRIRGAILDELRKGDWVPRSVHKNSRSISNAIAQIENRTGRTATDKEIADELAVTLSEYNNMLHDVNCAQIMAYEDLPCAHDTITVSEASHDTTFQKVSEDEHSTKLVEMIKELPEREALVLSLYYDEELNLKEIGLVLDVSESRVCQIHSQALHRLKSKNKDL